MKGDTILKVNLGYRYQTFQGELRTADGFTRGYEIALRLYISNPTLFALQYFQQSDPILLAQKEFELKLALYARDLNHDSMNEADIRVIANRDFSQATQQCCGVTIDQISGVYLMLDPVYAQVLGIRQNTLVEEVRLNEQAYLENIQFRDHMAMQMRRDEIQREQEIAFTVHEIRKAELADQHINRQNIGEAISKGMANRIEEQIARGYSIGEIMGENPEISEMLFSDREQRELQRPREMQLKLFAIVRTKLESDDRAFVGKAYFAEAGISQNRPEGFTGGRFDVSVLDPTVPILFDIVVHTDNSIELLGGWHQRLHYIPTNIEPQLVRFSFKVKAEGKVALTVNFYHERQWLQTVQLEFECIDQSQLAKTIHGE